MAGRPIVTFRPSGIMFEVAGADLALLMERKCVRVAEHCIRMRVHRREAENIQYRAGQLGVRVVIEEAQP